MSESSEYKLVKSLVWSNQDFSLAEFVKTYELPQVISVEVGYCGVTERTTFSSGQILTLHTLQTTNKVVCQVPHSNAIMIPLTCELKAEVIPNECHDTIVTAKQLSTHYQNVKYVRVMEMGSTWNNNSTDTLRVNDILQIKKVDNKNSVLRCKNLTCDQLVSILIDSTAVFVPLVQPETCTLAEIKKSFGFPVKIRFLDKKAEMKLRNVPHGARERPPQTILSDLGQLTAMEEIEDSDVIVTTVCSNLDEKMCLNVPTTLDIRVTVAEGFLSGDATYQKIVRTLDKELNRTDLKAFQDLDVYEHMDAVKRAMKELPTMLVVEEASAEVMTHARDNMKKTSLKRKPKIPFSIEKKPPKLKPRGQDSAQKAPPERPPKPGPKPTGQKPDPNTRKIGEKLKNLQLKSGDFLKSLGRKASDTKSPSSGESTGNEFRYNEAIDENQYASVDEISQELDYDSDSDNYTELDDAYTPVKPRPYEKLIKKPSETNSRGYEIPSENPQKERPRVYEKPSVNDRKPLRTPGIYEKPPELPTNSTPPPLPTAGPPSSKEDKQKIYEAIAKFPQDLCGLSITDVSRLLRYLHMEAYVEVFEQELVDGEMLSSMDQESLDSLNMSTFHAKKLLKFIGGWRPTVTS